MHQQLQLKIELASSCENLHILLHISPLPLHNSILGDLLACPPQLDLILCVSWVIFAFFSESVYVARSVCFGGHSGKYINEPVLYFCCIFEEMLDE
jgi:hypothetical protein